MRKAVVALLLGVSLSLTPAVLPVLSPSSAQAAEARLSRQSPNFGSWLLDILIVRPASLILVAGAVVTYPLAWLLDPLFGNDPEALKREWLTKNFDYAFERPLGNFDWRPR